MVQTSYVEGRWHQKWLHSRALLFFHVAMEIREKWKFFVKRSVTVNFQQEKISGQVLTESLSTQDSQYLYERGVETFFDSVVPRRSWKMPVRRQLPAKLGRCCKKLGGHNFNFRAKLWPPKFLQHLRRYFFLSWNEGQLWAAITRPLVSNRDSLPPFAIHSLNRLEKKFLPPF